MKNPNNAKERGLIKGALRRVFSRSELRKQALNSSRIEHTDVNRPRVTKWGFCNECGVVTPAYLLEVDHVLPVIPLNKSLEDLSWDQLVDNLWCSLDNLKTVCKPCHKEKSKAENKLRRDYRRQK